MFYYALMQIFRTSFKSHSTLVLYKTLLIFSAKNRNAIEHFIFTPDKLAISGQSAQRVTGTAELPYR